MNIMKKILLFFFSIIKFIEIHAQHPAISSAWDTHTSNTTLSPYDLATDDYGNAYITGYFQGTTTFNNGVPPIIASTGGSIYVVKYDKFGNTQWAINAGANGGQCQGFGIAVKPDGSEIYITGRINKVATFGSSILTPTIAGANYSDDIFVAKLLDNGGTRTWAWAMIAGGKGADYAASIDYDNAGKVYIGGTISSYSVDGDGNEAVVFGSLPIINCLNGDDSFVARITDNMSSASWDWVQKSTLLNPTSCSSSQTYDDNLRTVAVNKTNGDVYVGGQFYMSSSPTWPAIYLGSVAFTPASTYGDEGYIAKLNTAGTWQWVNRIGGPSCCSTEDIRDIALDSLGNVYVLGEFTNTSNFGLNANEIPSLTSAGTQDVFIGKINTSGTWVWSKRMGGTGNDNAGGIDYQNGQVWVVGSFRNSADFKTANQLTSIGFDDVFLASLDKNGNWLGNGAVRAGSAGNDDGGINASITNEKMGFDVDKDNVALATGVYTAGPADFGSTTLSKTSGGSFIFRANSAELPPICTVSMSATQPFLVTNAFNSNANLRIKSILKDGSGGTVIAGKLTGNVTVVFANGSQVVYAPANGSAFITHLNANNQAYWFEQMGGTDAIINDIAFGDNGILIVGDFIGTGSFKYANSRLGYDGYYTATPVARGSSDIFVGELTSFFNGTTNELLFGWLDFAGGTGIDHGAAIASHDGAFCAITGFVSYSTIGIKFGLYGTLTSPPMSAPQLFVASVGDYYVEEDNSYETYWAYFKSHTQPSSPVTAAKSKGYDVIVNASNEAIICGNYSFDDATNTSQAPLFGSTLMPPTNGQNLLVAKINNTGTWLWATKAGNNATAGHWHNAVSLTWGEDNFFYLTGGIQHTGASGTDVIKFGLTSTSEIQQMTSTQLSDILVAKLNTNGNWIWASRAGGVNIDYGLGINYKNQKVFITGYFISSINIGGTTLTSAGNTDIYFAQLTKLGQWIPNKAQRGGGSGDDGFYNNISLPFRVSLELDNNENAYTASFYTNSATFGTTALSNSFNSNNTALLVNSFCSTCSTSDITLVNPTHNVSSGQAEHKTTQKILATNFLLGGNTFMKAGKSIELNAGFKAETGTVFKAEIGGCN